MHIKIIIMWTIPAGYDGYQEWDKPCHQAYGELTSKLSLPPVPKFTLWQIFWGACEDFGIGGLLLQDDLVIWYGEHEARWLSKKIINPWKKNSLPQCIARNVATLLGGAQSKGLHEQFFLRVFWYTNANECQTIVEAQYLRV